MLLALLAFAAGWARSSEAARTLVMEQVARLEGPAADPMSQPTDVVVTSAGAAWVLDGVHMRLARFSPEGRFERYVKLEGPVLDDRRLPVGLGIDAAGRLLVGDRQRGTIQRLQGNGAVESTIAIPRDPEERPADPTDVMPSPSGQTLLVVDNDNHCVKEIDAAGQLVRRIGRRGSGPGEMNYPATVALAAAGEMAVVDVLNARVDVFDREGRALRAIGSQGVVAGKFYRPKGVAMDRSGRLHVGDSFTGLIQAFGLDGQLIGVWGTAGGQPHRLKSPATILADASGQFYVVEMLANCVTVWRERGKP